MNLILYKEFTMNTFENMTFEHNTGFFYSRTLVPLIRDFFKQTAALSFPTDFRVLDHNLAFDT